MPLRRILIFAAEVQAVLLAAHAFLYSIVRFFFWPVVPAWTLALPLGFLAVTFIPASFLAWRFPGQPVRALYTASAVWLGALNFLLLAAPAAWLAYAVAVLFRAPFTPREIALPLFLAAIAAALYGLANAARPRIVRVSIRLPSLPPQWRGRRAVLIGDSHLGHVRNLRFARRIAALAAGLRPDVVFLAGDVYDGTAVDAAALAAPFGRIPAPLGVFFVAGNHEQFSSPDRFFSPLQSAGVRILHNGKLLLDGLQLVGVHYRDAHGPRLREILRRAQIDPAAPSILLIHEPNELPAAAAAGISLQLSGHTHRGQFFPWTLAARRIFGPFAYGLHRFQSMQVYVTSGVGTWGPPLRLGTNPEIVLLTFE